MDWMILFSIGLVIGIGIGAHQAGGLSEQEMFDRLVNIRRLRKLTGKERRTLEDELEQASDRM